MRKMSEETLNRTLDYLNQAGRICKLNPRTFDIKSLAKECRVSAGRFTYAKALGYFKMTQEGHAETIRDYEAK